MNLFEVDDRIEELTERMIDPETGEIDDSILAEVESLELDKKKTIEHLAMKAKNLRAYAVALEAEKSNSKAKNDDNYSSNDENKVELPPKEHEKDYVSEASGFVSDLKDKSSNTLKDLTSVQEPDEKFCKNCGTKIEPGFLFCDSCGHKVD